MFTLLLKEHIFEFYFHSQQSDQGLHYLLFSAVWSGSTPFAILSLIRVYTICHSQSDQCLTVCHSQQSDPGVHHLPFSTVLSRSRSTLSFSGTVCLGSTLDAVLSSLIRVNNLHYLLFSALWSGSTLFAIPSLIRIYTICQSQQSDHCLHCHSQ